MDSYDKGKKAGKDVIANTISDTIGNIKTKSDMESLFSYLWGVRDAYTDILSMYMPAMIPIPLPDTLTDTEKAMYWELSSHIMAYYNTIKDEGSPQELIDSSTINTIDVILNLAKQKFSHDAYINMISDIRDHIDEVLVKEEQDRKNNKH